MDSRRWTVYGVLTHNRTDELTDEGYRADHPQ